MREYYVVRDNNHDHEFSHYDEESARKPIYKTHYIDKNGTKLEGKDHWTVEQIEAATATMKFPEGTTKWDKYVAFNTMYFDLCRVLDDASILKVAHAFYFADDDYDYKQSKIKRYMDCMSI